MSVCIISPEEFGLFAAIATHLKIVPFAEAVAVAELLAIGNHAAHAATYQDRRDAEELAYVPPTADDIEAIALPILARKQFTIENRFGPILYNCVSNGGRLFLGELECTDDQLEQPIRELCDKVSKWHDAELRRIARQREDDQAFTEVGPLPILSADELRARMDSAGASRLIIAQFSVDESDSQSDYFGGRSGRTVVIGFGTGKRESFKQLRTAAGEFPPTAAYGPGRDRWTVSAFKGQQNEYGCADREQLRDDSYRTMEFPTKADAETYVAHLIATAEECQPGYSGCIGFPRFAQTYGVEYHCESFEHRENYSMGGGNYLGRHRHGGWKVYSRESVGPCEIFEAPKPVAGESRKRKSSAPRPVAVETIPVVDGTFDAELMELAALVERLKLAEVNHETDRKVRLKRGRAYVNVDFGDDIVGWFGVYMVNVNTRAVYGIRSYGQIDKRRYCGTVAGFIARLKGKLPAPRSVETVASLYHANV